MQKLAALGMMAALTAQSRSLGGAELFVIDNDFDDRADHVAEHRRKRAEEQARARAQREAAREAIARPRIEAAEAKRAKRRARNLKLLQTV